MYRKKNRGEKKTDILFCMHFNKRNPLLPGQVTDEFIRAWKRLRNEYRTSLWEWHNLKHNKRETEVRVGEVVVIEGDGWNKAQWKLKIITEVKEVRSRDGKS